ncbi:MAG: heme exporter protein B [Phenylobacterium sp.]|jgi:heme exporter protein B
MNTSPTNSPTNSSNNASSISYGQVFVATLKRDLQLALRQRVDVINPLFFYVLVIILFPIGVGPEPNLLQRIAPGVIWVAALLSTLLGVEKLFKEDYIDGTLEQLILSPVPLHIIALAKIVAHWCISGLPIILVSPLLAAFLNVNQSGLIAVILTLLVATPLLSIIAAIGAALTVGLQKGGVLISLLVLPLNIPILIFATSAVDSAIAGLAYNGQLAILGAMLVVALITGPFAVSSSLKVSVS